MNAVFLTIILLLILSGPEFHKNLKNIFSSLFINSFGGAGSILKRWTNLESVRERYYLMFTSMFLLQF